MPVQAGQWAFDDAEARFIREIPTEQGEQGWGWPRNDKYGWIPCRAGSTNIPLQLLRGIDSLEFHRVLVAPPSTMGIRKTGHDFPIGKEQPGSSHDICDECAELLVRLLRIGDSMQGSSLSGSR